MPETVVETRNLESGYGKLTILHGISMHVDRNEIVAVVGPNGSGKSTLVKSIYGLAKVHSGEVIFLGRPIIKVGAEDSEAVMTKRNIDRSIFTHAFRDFIRGSGLVKRLQGRTANSIRADKLTKMGASYVPQLANAFLNLTVRDNLELGTLVGKHNSKDDSIDRVFQIFPILRERQRQKAATLSGGERQMLAIGRTLMVTPQLLILDEPTATLSPKFASEVFQKISEIRDHGVTILMVEQNAKKALEMSDRGYVLVAGKKVYEGPSKEILSNQEFGKIFLGLAGGR